MEFCLSTIQAGRAMPKVAAWGPSGLPYFSQFSLDSSLVSLRGEGEGKEREKGRGRGEREGEGKRERGKRGGREEGNKERERGRGGKQLNQYNFENV